MGFEKVGFSVEMVLKWVRLDAEMGLTWPRSGAEVGAFGC